MFGPAFLRLEAQTVASSHRRYWTTVRTTDALSDFVGPFLLKLFLLPGPVDDRMKFLRELRRPNLLADHQVLRVHAQCQPPELNRSRRLSLSRELMTVLDQTLNFLRLLLTQVIRLFRLSEGLDAFAREEPTHDIDVITILDRESAVLCPADGPVRVNQHAVGNRLEAEEGARRTLFIDEYRERHPRLLDERTSQLCTVMLQSDAYDLTTVLALLR